MASMSLCQMAVVKKKKDMDDWVRLFEVTDPCRHPKGHTVYKVTSTVFPKNAPEAATQICVWRRFSDFKRIYQTLCTLHANLHLSGTFPAFPKDQLFGRFEPRVIEERRLSALKLLEFVALHAPLFTSQAFVKFFESGKDSNSVGSNDKALISNAVLQPMKISVADADDYRRTTPEDAWILKTATDDLNSEETTSDVNDCGCNDSANVNRGRCDNALMLLSLFDPLGSTVTNPNNDDDERQETPCLLDDSGCESCDNGSSNFPKAFADYEEDDDDGGDRSAGDRLDADDCVLLNDENGYGCGTNRPPVVDTRNGLDWMLGDADADVNSDLMDSFREDYVFRSAQLLHGAQESEVRGDFEAAFTLYKQAIDILLTGVREDLDGNRREAVRRKTAQYLRRAEEIYANLLTSPQRRNLLESESMDSSLRSPASELGRYKVLGIIDRVLLVFDSTDGIVCVLKVVSKSPCDGGSSKAYRLPVATHMVQLLRYHETKDAVFLVLEYAAGGRLWSRIGSRIRSGGVSGCDAGCDEPFESRACNVYAGRKFLADHVEVDGGSTDERVHMDTNRLVANARALLKDVDATLDDSNAISMHRTHSDEDDGLHDDTENDSKEHVQHRRHRLRTQRPNSTDRRRRRSSSCSGGGGGGSYELQQSVSRVRHFSSVFREMDGSIADKDGCGSRIPASCVRIWAAEIASAVMTLHSYGVVCRNLNPSNVLLDRRGHVLLTYFASLPGVVDAPSDTRVKEAPYIAPELFGIDGSTNQACADWFSFGAILFAMLTGRTLSSCHPSGFGGHTTLKVPCQLPVEAESILRELLCANPRERLGGGADGDAAVRHHPFFADIDWRQLHEPRLRSAPTSANEIV